MKEHIKNDLLHSPVKLVGDFQMAVLSAVQHLGSNAHGRAVLEYLTDKLGREIHTPQVYAALTRLTKLGLISSAIDKQASVGRRGRPRRKYQLKVPGLRTLEAGVYLSSLTVPVRHLNAQESKRPATA